MARIPDSSDQFLAHYGIVGMKWGKRRAKSSTSSSSKNAPTPFKKDPNRDPPPAKGVTDLRPKHVKRISDAELRQRLNRIQMETQYKDLIEGKSNNAPQSKAKKALNHVNKGHKAVIAILAVAGTAQKIYKLYNSPMVREMRGLPPEKEKKEK
jgi:hypothetical protein